MTVIEMFRLCELKVKPEAQKLQDVEGDLCPSLSYHQ
jgi:hypothetical protein